MHFPVVIFGKQYPSKQKSAVKYGKCLSRRVNKKDVKCEHNILKSHRFSKFVFAHLEESQGVR